MESWRTLFTPYCCKLFVQVFPLLDLIKKQKYEEREKERKRKQVACY